MELKDAGIALTYDDWFVDGWHSALDLFDRYNAKATFFVAKMNGMSKEQIKKLQEMQERGHEIGCHTMNHVGLWAYLEKYGLKQYLKEEIDDAIALMKSHGFDPLSFSYPFFKHDDEVTDELLMRFNIVRTARPVRNYGTYHLKGLNNAVTGTSFVTDKTGLEKSVRYYASRFSWLKETRGYTVACGHAIGDRFGPRQKFYSNLEDLEIILSLAKASGFQFMTMQDLA